MRSCKYPPERLRGVGPRRAANVWGVSRDEYLEIANDETMVIIQIERVEAIKNIEDIVSVEGIDVVFIGPSDLSASMGLIGKPFHPKVQDAMDKVIDASRDSGVVPGIAYGLDIAHIKYLIAKGFRFIGIGGDIDFLMKGCSDTLKKIRK